MKILPPLFANDIGNFIGKASFLSEDAKYDLLCNVWKPSENYKFPLDEGKRKFQHRWLAKFPWLVYSEVCNGAFCINCFLFAGESTHNSAKLKNLFTAPLKKWTSALQKLNEHSEKSSFHSTATLRATQFKLLKQRKNNLSRSYS